MLRIAVPAAGLGLLLSAQVATAKPPAPVQSTPSLSGETLKANPTEAINCVNGPTGASFVGALTGDASGPYPGTFQETFSLTSDNSVPTPPPGTSGRVLTFTAAFAITADDGTTITGTKTLQTGTNSGTASCKEFFVSAGSGVRGVSGSNILTSYTAQITGPGGTSTDQGTAQTSFVFEVTFLPGGGQFQTADFTETFGAQQAQKPGKGCGDKNHTHEREDECKTPAR